MLYVRSFLSSCTTGRHGRFAARFARGRGRAVRGSRRRSYREGSTRVHPPRQTSSALGTGPTRTRARRPRLRWPFISPRRSRHRARPRTRSGRCTDRAPMSRSAAFLSPSRTRTAPSACTRVRARHARSHRVLPNPRRVDLSRWIIRRSVFSAAKNVFSAPPERETRAMRETRADTALTTPCVLSPTLFPAVARGWRTARRATAVGRSQRPRRRRRLGTGVAPDEAHPRRRVPRRRVENLVAARTAVRGGRGGARGRGRDRGVALVARGFGESAGERVRRVERERDGRERGNR